jgi:hypothetical protein
VRVVTNIISIWKGLRKKDKGKWSAFFSCTALEWYDMRILMEGRDEEKVTQTPLKIRKLRVSRVKYMKVPLEWVKKHPKLEPTTHCHPPPYLASNS